MFAPDGTARSARIPRRAISWDEQGWSVARDRECHVDASGGRSLQALRGGPGCPRERGRRQGTIPPPDEERERRRAATKLMQEQIALLEAQESLLRRMSRQG